MLPEFKKSKEYKRYKFMQINNSGIFDININQTVFKMLMVNNDDTSIIDSIVGNVFPSKGLLHWEHWTKKYPGIFIDVGAHTGIFTLLGLQSNQKNYLITIEPLPINYYRILTNLRLNNYTNKRFLAINKAVSNEDKTVKFKIHSDQTYLSKGGKISEKGIDVHSIKLDNLIFKNLKHNICGLKIDTEGEDLNVLFGAEGLIKKFSPKILIEVRKKNLYEIINFLSKLGYNHFYENEKNESEEILTKFENEDSNKDICAEKI